FEKLTKPATTLEFTPAEVAAQRQAWQIAIVISLLSFSFLGDMFGYRRIYKCGLVVFLLSSLFCQAIKISIQIKLTVINTMTRFSVAAWRY
ncbi:hypothetical protein O5833_27550, partial [Escherichia coli]|nr:hypothetical protein [Escherichia coli]